MRLRQPLVVGGELSLAGELLLDPLREVVWRSAIRSAAETARIVPGVLGERAELLGALALVFMVTGGVLLLAATVDALSRRGRQAAGRA